MNDEDFESESDSDGQRVITDTDTDRVSDVDTASDTEIAQERFEEMLEEEHDRILHGFYYGEGCHRSRSTIFALEASRARVDGKAVTPGQNQIGDAFC